MEAEHGRSRVFAQWCDTEDNIQVRHRAAQEMDCPVNSLA